MKRETWWWEWAGRRYRDRVVGLGVGFEEAVYLWLRVAAPRTRWCLVSSRHGVVWEGER